MHKLLLSWAFLAGALVLGIWATVAVDYDQNLVVLYFLAPYYALVVGLQYVWPVTPNKFEKNEVITDLLNNVGLLALTALQGTLVYWMASGGSGLLFQWGWIDEGLAARNLPMWGQVLVSLLVFDLMFYVTHRISHEVEFFWRFHSVHHSAHRLSFLNASRVHPLDITWRRLVPLFVTYQTGPTPEAVIVATVIGTVLAVLTHANVDFRFGPLNYVFGSNEIHRWHHSAKMEEAKNFSVLMVWDHVFGTFVYPKTRTSPRQMGLFNELHYPRQSFWGQLLIPFRWKRWKARQAVMSQPVEPPRGTFATQGQRSPDPSSQRVV